jgi:hypothetical protein
MRDRARVMHTAAMGKLAERLADPKRSGVYRVETTEALEEAVALNGFTLVRVGDSPLAPGRPLAPRGDGHVLLFSGFGRSAWNATQHALAALAAERRAAGQRFFAIFLDPEAALPLAPLYNWLRKPKEETHGTDETHAA